MLVIGVKSGEWVRMLPVGIRFKIEKRKGNLRVVIEAPQEQRIGREHRGSLPAVADGIGIDGPPTPGD